MIDTLTFVRLFEYRLVLEQIMALEDDRKCWRLVNGVMFEKTKAQVVPEI